MAVSTATYGSEGKHETRIQTADMKFLRRIDGYKRTYH